MGFLDWLAGLPGWAKVLIIGGAVVAIVVVIYYLWQWIQKKLTRSYLGNGTFYTFSKSLLTIPGLFGRYDIYETDTEKPIYEVDVDFGGVYTFKPKDGSQSFVVKRNTSFGSLVGLCRRYDVSGKYQGQATLGTGFNGVDLTINGQTYRTDGFTLSYRVITTNSQGQEIGRMRYTPTTTVDYTISDKTTSESDRDVLFISTLVSELIYSDNDRKDSFNISFC